MDSPTSAAQRDTWRPPDDVSIERRLLAWLLSGRELSSGEWEALAAGVNWDRLFAETGAQLWSFVSDAISRTPLAARVPPHVHARLLEARHRSALACVRQNAVLRSALAVLQRQNIECVVLKGAVLRYLAYSDPTLRPMTDVDVWIASGRLDEAVEALMAEGWRGPRGGQDQAPGAETAGSRMLRHPEIAVTVELHSPPQSFAHLSPSVQDVIWHRATPTRLGDVDVRALDPRDVLLHVGLGARKDRFSVGLRPLLDIRLLIERQGASWDWPVLAREWEQFGTSVAMFVALSVAQRVIGADASQALGHLSAPPEHDEMCRLAGTSAIEAVSFRLPSYAATVGAAESRRERLVNLLRRLTIYYLPQRRGAWRTPVRAAADIVSRIGHDLVVKGWRDRRFWRQFFFSRRHVQQGIEIVRARAHLDALMRRADDMSSQTAGIESR